MSSPFLPLYTHQTLQNTRLVRVVVVPSSQGATLSDRYPSAIRGAVGFYDHVEVPSNHGYGGSARSLTTPSVPNNALLLLTPVHICCHFNLENLFVSARQSKPPMHVVGRVKFTKDL